MCVFENECAFISLVYLFNGISTFVGYSVSKPSSLNSIITIQSIAEGLKGSYFSRGH